jgi:hypothetical protein
MPADLVGKCFNCLCLGHVAADCPNPVRCLRCHREGHHAQCYKCSGPPEATGPPRPQKLASVVVLIPAKGDIALAEPSRSRASTRPSQHGLSTPLNMDQASMLEGSPSRHILPSPPPESPPYLQGSPPPPSPPPPGPSGAAECPRHFELRVIPRTQAMNEAEAALANALVMMVGGARPVISPEQIRQHLSQFYSIAERDVQVKRYSCADFLLIFASRLLADSMLHALPPLLQQADFPLVFRRWSYRARALFKPFRFKVLVSITNVPVHVWSVETIQAIVGSSCSVFAVAPQSLNQSDLSSFLVVV